LKGYSRPVTRIALTRHETEARLTAVAPAIRALGVIRLALFGSVLRDQARPDSDVDFLVQFAPGQKTFSHFEALADLLEQELGHRVELVTPEALSPFLGPCILAEAMDVLRAA
jgi:predicted nucleotidyltransferase